MIRKYRYIVYFVFTLIIFACYMKMIDPWRPDFDGHIYTLVPHINGLEPYHPNYLVFVQHVSYLMVHKLISIFYMMGLDLKVSAAIVLSSITLFKLLFIDSLFSKKSLFSTLITCGLCIFMPIMGLRSGDIYVGKYIGNIWHNPTYIMVIPFALLCCYYFNKIYIKRESTKLNLFILSILMLASIYAKASFIVAFIPTCGIYLLLNALITKNWKIFFSDALSGIIISIPSLMYVFYEVFFMFSGDSSSIIFAPFQVWLLDTNNIILAICLSLFCPLFYYFYSKGYKDRYLNFSFILLCVGFIYYALLAESGVRFAHGNMCWTYMICGFMFFINCIVDCAKKHPLKECFSIANSPYLLVYALFLLHVISGIIYLYQMTNYIIAF